MASSHISDYTDLYIITILRLSYFHSDCVI